MIQLTSFKTTHAFLTVRHLRLENTLVHALLWLAGMAEAFRASPTTVGQST
ncbi:hypothetical protein RSSM_02144 [Rhodopirellula sallentina SM41]|uniref:Uncharacterized protein n=1 Tax=Rhodopirellula sallentina SM41 TaxID=1263870 RepID=M5U4N4_9BACT|nr:hypothetical protein RSSM_02144 [Rhodopirellula sallentina SM41]